MKQYLFIGLASAAVFAGGLTHTALAQTDTTKGPSPTNQVQPRTPLTEDGYQNTDSLRGLFNQRPVFVSQCALNPQIGPLATPAPGSPQAQPGYERTLDADIVGACRKPI